MEPNRIYQAFITSGNEWAEAQYAYQQLDDQSKSILAHLTLEAKDIEGVKSMAEAHLSMRLAQLKQPTLQ